MKGSTSRKSVHSFLAKYYTIDIGLTCKALTSQLPTRRLMGFESRIDVF